MHISWMMLRKQGALNNQMLRLGVVCPPYKNSWLRAWLYTVFLKWISLYVLLW